MDVLLCVSVYLVCPDATKMRNCEWFKIFLCCNLNDSSPKIWFRKVTRAFIFDPNWKSYSILQKGLLRFCFLYLTCNILLWVMAYTVPYLNNKFWRKNTHLHSFTSWMCCGWWNMFKTDITNTQWPVIVSQIFCKTWTSRSKTNKNVQHIHGW